MSDPGGRIICSRCGSNNFAGKPNCWQCSAPLAGNTGRPAQSKSTTTPDARRNHVSQPAPQRPYTAPFADPFVRKWGMSRGMAVILGGVGIGVFLAVWFVAGRPRGNEEVLRSEPGPSRAVSSPATADQPLERTAAEIDDPIVDESKRFIDHESRHAGLPQPPTGSDGRVHLRSGGSITTDQYRDAQRRVNDSPVIRNPIPPPPMP